MFGQCENLSHPFYQLKTERQYIYVHVHHHLHVQLDDISFSDIKSVKCDPWLICCSKRAAKIDLLTSVVRTLGLGGQYWH